MSSADLATVVIVCPNCGTRYQVPYGTLGPDGREVQCAQCSKPWHAEADAPHLAVVENDQLFSGADENALDIAFEAEAKAVAPHPAPVAVVPANDPEHDRMLAEIRSAIAPKPKPDGANAIDPALLNKKRRAFARRQHRIQQLLPAAKVRRTARIVGFVLLAAVLVAGFTLRTNLVGWFPSLAGFYSAIGLPVNIVGLEFDTPRTLTSLREGKTMMLVTARIRSVSAKTVPVPPVLVSLIDANGEAIYEWTVAPKAAEMGPGDVLELSTEVNAPPVAVARVRLSFTTGRAGATATTKAD